MEHVPLPHWDLKDSIVQRDDTRQDSLTSQDKSVVILSSNQGFPTFLPTPLYAVLFWVFWAFFFFEYRTTFLKLFFHNTFFHTSKSFSSFKKHEMQNLEELKKKS